jgi:phosphoribosyl 1,2-cyclic phosphate phosphodiesterase
MNAGEAYRLAKSLNARKVVFSHLSHFYPPHYEAAAVYPVGKDMQEFIFDEDNRD